MRNFVKYGILAGCHNSVRLSVSFIASENPFHSVILYVTERSLMTAVLWIISIQCHRHQTLPLNANKYSLSVEIYFLL
jgi:hypothetical protein